VPEGQAKEVLADFVALGTKITKNSLIPLTLLIQASLMMRKFPIYEKLRTRLNAYWSD
jgi:hypothetical protein